jgi:hypothetical protein
LPHEILEMTSKFMTDPIRILVKRDELTLEGNIDDRNKRYFVEYIILSPNPVFKISVNKRVQRFYNITF